MTKNDVLINANNLSKMIMESDEYIRFVKIKETVESNAEIFNIIKGFKKLQLEYQIKVMRNENPSLDDEKYISKVYSDLMVNDTIREFITCEKELLATYEEVFEIISDGCNLDLNM